MTTSTIVPSTGIIASLPQLVIAAVPDNIPAYNRDEWRQWIDEDGDCQNTRHKVLIEESWLPVTFVNSSECSVASGQWLAQFTRTIVSNAYKLGIDHMVPLANAHRSGAWVWDAEMKKTCANHLSYEGH